MPQPLYRDYSQWILAMEPKLAWVHLSREQFRRLAGLLALLFVVVGLLLVSRMAVIKNGYEIVELRQERDRLLALTRQEQRHVSELKSLEYAETVARRDLGMVDVSPNQVIYLQPQDSPSGFRRLWDSLQGG
jgi:cell division protein FtsB